MIRLKVDLHTNKDEEILSHKNRFNFFSVVVITTRDPENAKQIFVKDIYGET